MHTQMEQQLERMLRHMYETGEQTEIRIIGDSNTALLVMFSVGTAEELRQLSLKLKDFLENKLSRS